jgi:hypothetical protein
MSNSQQFDKYIKEQFSDYTPDVHPRIWENIAARTERKKPVGFWQSLGTNKNKLLLAGMLLFLTTGTAWWYVSNRNAITDNQPVADNKTSNGNKNNVNNQQPAAHQNNITEQQPVVYEITTGKTGDIDPVQKTASPLSDKAAGNIIIYNPLQTNDDITATNNVTGKKPKATKGLLRMQSLAPATDEEEEEYAMDGSLLGRLSFNAELISAKRKAKNPLALTFQQIAFLPDCPSVEKNAAGNKKYLELYAGPDYAFRSFSDTGNSEYLRRRKESTKFSSAYSAGVRYTRVFNNSMSVRAGVNYSQINEKFTFTQGNLVQITYIIGANGDTLGSYTTTGTRYKTINRFRSVDIPVAIGYELGNGRWHANVNAGVVVNVYSWQKGDVLDTAYNPVSITTGKNSSPYQFKTNAGVGFIGGVSVYYKLNDRLHLMAEPYFRYNFSPINKDNITLKQKYQTAGLRVGIRVDLK